MKVVVTGGTGKAGRWVVQRLRDSGYDVLNVDQQHDGSAHGLCLVADLTDPGQCYDALAGAEAVVHLAALPAPEGRPAAETLRSNMFSPSCGFAAAEAHALSRVVYASSETVLGLPFDEPPDFAPIDETHPLRPESSYSLAKVAGETIADQFVRRTRTPYVGLRISNIMEPEDYAAFPSHWDDPRIRKWNLWGYVDARDVAMACDLGLTAEVEGHEVAIIAAADNCMTRDSAGLMAEVYPDVPITRELHGRETLLAIDRARATLGYEPQYSWSDEVAGGSAPDRRPGPA